MKSILWKSATVAILFAIANTVSSEGELEGAEKILFALDDDTSEESADANSRPEELLKTLQAYRAEQSSFSSSKRASQWIGMVYSMATWGQPEFLRSYASPDPETKKPIALESLIVSMPPPKDWKALWRAFEAYDASAVPEHYVAGLRLFVAALEPRGGHLEKAIAGYRNISTDAMDEYRQSEFKQALVELEATAALQRNDMEGLLEGVRAETLAADTYGDSVDVPDVINILGREKGTQWLTEMLTNARRSVEVPIGDETRTEAKRISLTHVDKLQTAHWGLIADFDSIALYEAFSIRFPSGTSVTELYGARPAAQTYYMLSLLSANRIDEATKQLRALGMRESFSLNSNMLQELESAGKSQQVQAFMQALLKSDPNLKIWRPYLQLSSRIGMATSAAAFTKSLLKSVDPEEGTRADLEVRYAEALLALNDTDSALKHLSASMDSADLDTQSDLGLKLARLGALLQDSKLERQGFATVSDVLSQTRGQEDAYWRADSLSNFVELARDTGRFAEAEALLREEMVYTQSYLAGYAEIAGTAAQGYFSQMLKPLAVELTGIYAAAQSWEDVLFWIDNFQHWGNVDIASIMYEEDAADDALGIHFARALVETGRATEAKPVLRRLLEKSLSNDKAYALYSSIDPTSAVAFYDELFTRDPYEERPLIWKAALLLEQGATDEAFATIEQAISIDPSDGETGAGDRMRAYTVYANILAERGADQKAESMRDAVAAIRLSEDADRFHDAGLYTKSIEMYKKSASKFDGAYCIQSRLATQLTKQGRFSEAAPHFERAYSLMPESFGRVESHCFRCESVFDDVRAQNIADSVFSRMLEEVDSDPKTQYMMGYLRQEQGKYDEALKHFRAAVQIDPLYLSAWKQMQNVSKKIHVDAAEANAVAIKIRELDPLKRHGSFDYSNVTDLRSLWNVSNRNYARFVQNTDVFYALRASTALMQQQSEDNGNAALLTGYFANFDDSNGKVQHPGLELVETPFIKAAVSAMFPSQNLGY